MKIDVDESTASVTINSVFPDIHSAWEADLDKPQNSLTIDHLIPGSNQHGQVGPPFQRALHVVLEIGHQQNSPAAAQVP